MRRIIGMVMLSLAASIAVRPAEAQDSCSDYAKHAVEQVQLMLSHPNCRVQPVMRWAPSFQNQYNGCRVLPAALLRHEQSERDKWLKACGAVAPPSAGPADANAALAAMLSQQPGPLDPAQIPIGLVMCHTGECEHGNKGTWIFRGGSGIAHWPGGQVAKLTILRFDANSVLIRREDLPNSTSPGFVAMYEGTRRGERIDGKIRTAWPGHFPNGKPPGTMDFQFYAVVPHTMCTGTDSGFDDPIEVAQTAVQFRQPKSAFACFMTAAKQGNAQAKGALAVMYRDGIGTDADAQQAFHWAQLGAQQGDYNSEVVLSQMYASGIGTRPDSQQADFWRAQAQKNPVVLQQQAQAEARANMQKMALLGMAALVEALTTPDFVIVR